MQNNLISKISSMLQNFSEEYAISISNKGIYKRSVKELQGKELMVEWNEERIRVQCEEFWVEINEEPSSFKCSCPSRNICKHVIMSYLYLKEYKNKLFGEMKIDELEIPISVDKKKQEEKEKGNENRKAKDKISIEDIIKTNLFVKEIIKSIYSCGLARCPNSIIRDVEQGAILCKGVSLTKQEKELRIIKEELQSYVDKSPLFDFKNLVNTLSRVTLRTIELERDDSGKIAEMILKSRGEYKGELKGELIGVGGEYFKTKSGFEGVSIFLYSIDRAEIFSLTNVQPTIYEKGSSNISDLWNGKSYWDRAISLKNIISQRIIISNGRVSEGNRLSTSKDTKGILKGKLNGHEIFEMIPFKEDFSELKVEFEKVGFYFLLISNYLGKNYNATNGILEIKICDKNSREECIKVKKQDFNMKFIEKLERLYEIGGLSNKMFCKVYEENGEKIICPISFFVKGSILNLWI